MKWGFWEPAEGYRPAKGGVSLMSHSNGSVAHGWSECISLQVITKLNADSLEGLSELGQKEYVCRSRHLPLVGGRWARSLFLCCC